MFFTIRSVVFFDVLFVTVVLVNYVFSLLYILLSFFLVIRPPFFTSLLVFFLLFFMIFFLCSSNCYFYLHSHYSLYSDLPFLKVFLCCYTDSFQSSIFYNFPHCWYLFRCICSDALPFFSSNFHKCFQHTFLKITINNFVNLTVIISAHIYV